MTLYGKLANLHNAPAVRCAWSLTRRHLNGSGAVVTGTENCSSPHSRGLVLGVYANEADEMDAGILTPVATLYNEVNYNVENHINLLGVVECAIFDLLASDKGASFELIASVWTDAKTWRMPSILRLGSILSGSRCVRIERQMLRLQCS